MKFGVDYFEFHFKFGAFGAMRRRVPVRCGGDECRAGVFVAGVCCVLLCCVTSLLLLLLFCGEEREREGGRLCFSNCFLFFRQCLAIQKSYLFYNVAKRGQIWWGF